MLSNMGDFLSNGENLIFFFFALLAIGGGVYMLSFTKLVHMAVAMALTFLSLAGIYVLLNAEFLAFVQVMIYAGAVTILMIFGIMMTKQTDEEKEVRRPLHEILTAIGVLGLFGILYYAIQQTELTSGDASTLSGPNTQQLGELLMGEYALPFEIMSVLLTVALIGAIIIAKREED